MIAQIRDRGLRPRRSELAPPARKPVVPVYASPSLLQAHVQKTSPFVQAIWTYTRRTGEAG